MIFRLNVNRIKIVLLVMSFSFHGCNQKGNQDETEKKQTTYTVLGLGDSITEGKGENKSYLFPLWEKLYSAGYLTEFIGPNAHKCRIGRIMNAGYSGRKLKSQLQKVLFSTNSNLLDFYNCIQLFPLIYYKKI